MNVSRRRYISVAGDMPFDRQYLTFEALEAGTFTLTILSGLGTSYLKNVSYSLDGGKTWTTTSNVASTEVVITTPSVAAGDKVLWKGDGKRYGVNSNNGSKFSSTGSFNAYGNMMSLLYNDDFANEDAANQYMFPNLFNGSKLVDASNIIFPTSINSYCYLGCFRNCTLLTDSPILPATTLVGSCYKNMFRGCSSLTYIKCLATDISATDCTASWVNGVAATGTFVKAASMGDWTTGYNGIPDGWTIIDA